MTKPDWDTEVWNLHESEDNGEKDVVGINHGTEQMFLAFKKLMP